MPGGKLPPREFGPPRFSTSGSSNSPSRLSARSLISADVLRGVCAVGGGLRLLLFLRLLLLLALPRALQLALRRGSRLLERRGRLRLGLVPEQELLDFIVLRLRRHGDPRSCAGGESKLASERSRQR